MRHALARLVRIGGPALLVGAIACEAAPQVPDAPTWVDDVEPILRGNCFHCHGSAADPAKYATSRWDFYDFSAASSLGNFGAVVSAKDPGHFPLIVAFATMAAGANSRMPPPPAEPLSDYDKQVLKNWMTAGYPKGQRNPNHPPQISWAKKPTTFAITDVDHEEVLGKLACPGAGDTLLPHSGSFSMPPGATFPCTATLYDGNEMVTATLRAP